MNKTAPIEAITTDIEITSTKKDKLIYTALFLVGATIGGAGAYLGCKQAGLLDTPEQ